MFSGSPRSDLGGDSAFVDTVIVAVTVHSESAPDFPASMLFLFLVVIDLVPVAD